MVRHRTQHRVKRQVGQDYLAGETLHGLAKRHDLSRNLIRIWIQKFEAGAFEDESTAADTIQAYEFRIAALERLVGRQALEISKGGSEARTAAEKRDYVRDHRPRASMTFSLLGAGAMSPPPIAVTTSRSSRTWRKRSCPMAPTSSGSRTSPMSRSQADSFMSPSSSTPGHARWWAMRSPGRSTCG